MNINKRSYELLLVLVSLALILPLFSLAGCGHGSSQKVAQNPGYGPVHHGSVQHGSAGRAPGSDAPAAEATAAYDDDGASYDADDGYGEAESAPRSSGAYRRHRPEPEERPGLGTVWGESVDSRVQTRPFVRDSSRPFAAVAMHYNDESGVRAHMNYLGSHQLSPVRAYTPHGGISVALTDEYGNLLPGGAAGGKVLVVGRAGQRYNVVIHNQTGGRYEIVASVDGLDVIDGRPADVRKRGYILEPHGTLTIDGFRQSEHHVAAFRFGRVSQSYAARTSGDRNVGVIGVALFAEQGSRWTSDELYRRDTAQPFPGDRYAQPPSY